MNKFIAWNNETNRLDPCWYPLIGGDKEISIIGIQDNRDHEQLLEDNACEIYQSTGKTDIHGNEIYYDFHIVKFKYNAAFAIWVEHIGVFRYNKDELRGEIDISDQRDCICLWYDSSIISNLEIIGNVKENPELMEEGERQNELSKKLHTQ
jgi:hypothetical protein